MKYAEPLSSEILTNLFRTSKDDDHRIINREGSTIEFKKSFGYPSMPHYFKTMASFANHRGGYIIFGVGEKPRKLLGLKGSALDKFENLKVEEFTLNLRNYFSPEIKWDHCTFEFKNLSFGVIYTFEAEKKPCICKKAHEDKNPKFTLREGDIFYRYNGRSERIKYTELVRILDETRNKEEEKWMNLFRTVSKAGVDNIGLLNLDEGIITGNSGSIIIDEELLSKISFIKEGEFVEKKGKPTLRLVGDVKEINTGKVIVSKGSKKTVRAIEINDIIDGFLDHKKVDNPEEYIRAICYATSANYPIYYYIKQTQGTITDVIKMIEQSPIRNETKKRILKRLDGLMINESYTTKEGASNAARERKEYLEKWKKENIETDIKNVKRCIEALLSLPAEDVLEHESFIRRKLKQIVYSDYEKADPILAGIIRKAICKVDELLYANNVQVEDGEME